MIIMTDPEDPIDENYDLEEPEETEEPQDISSYFNVPFTEERLQNVYQLRSSAYKIESMYILDGLTIYPGSRAIIKSFIDQFLSSMSILTNFPSLEMALIDYDQARINLIHSLYPSDLKISELFTLLELVRTQFKSIIYRAMNADRERIINGRESMEQRHVTKQDPIMVKPQQKRKNILGF